MKESRDTPTEETHSLRDGRGDDPWGRFTKPVLAIRLARSEPSPEFRSLRIIAELFHPLHPSFDCRDRYPHQLGDLRGL
jgi:hypothetical protein